ncbi:MAG: HAD family hydrolase [Phocaeicola sp.]|uniref:HAD family hydrolase n=1 Tax=Phocaeicola TaxID=909656 RepID=UPI00234EB92B|nr:HAD-IA family hydrolase [Phocaeicola oris]MCE2617351.1 HAD-IA family hydrolase [Phocaeicola oris]
MKYTTYLFDFDYTLVDSSRGIVFCFQTILKRYGYVAKEDDIKQTIGKTLEDSFRLLTEVTNQTLIAKYAREYHEVAAKHMTSLTCLYPETKQVLELLKKNGAKLGIISSKGKELIHEMMGQYFPDNFFDVILGIHDVKKSKPDAEGINKVLKALHANRTKTLYIGDSVIDAQTAQNAHIDFCGVLNGITSRKELEIYPHRKILNNLFLLPYLKKLE